MPPSFLRHQHLIVALIVAVGLLGLASYSWQWDVPSDGLSWVVPGSLTAAPSKPASTRYLFRDWSLHLGFNNMKYILEAAALSAHLLGRTLVVPSFVYLRSCEVEQATCSMYLDQVNRRVEAHMEEGAKDDKDALRWRIDIHEMINLTALADGYTPIITMADFLAEHDLPASFERSDGHSVFSESTSLDAAQFLEERFSVHKINQTGEYDTDPLYYNGPPYFRFDTLPAIPAISPLKHAQQTTLAKQRQELADARLDAGHVTLADAQRIMGVDENTALQVALAQVGWLLAYTFEAPNKFEMNKAVVFPETQVMERVQAKGWVDDYADVDADILLLPGEVHDGRKPGFMRFSTPSARQDFADHIIHHTRPLDVVLQVAEDIAETLNRRTEGRGYMGAHMRRGDFVGRLKWSPDDFEGHITNLKERFEVGREILRDLKLNDSAPLPRYDDPFFVATDEQDPTHLEQLREAGAVVANDLLTPAHRRSLGWPALFVDFQSEIEQAVLARARFFGGGKRSSVPGWVLNQRAALGQPVETGVLFESEEPH